VTAVKNAIRVPIWPIIIVALCLCALYSLGIIRSANAGQIVQKEYDAWGLTYTYTGPMLDGKFSGVGEIHFSDGNSYYGSFLNGRFEGDGVFTSPYGWRFDGVFVAGEITGEGALYGTNGEVLTKDKNEIFHFVSAAGWEYTGSFNEWGQTGTGRFVFPDGAVYEGGFARGMADGDGVYTTPDGVSSYTGGFKSGLFDGEGALMGKDGIITLGAWSDGELVTRYD